MPIINPICHTMWSLTPYDKCDFRCVYCCTKVQGTSRPTVPLEGLTPAGYARIAHVIGDLIGRDAPEMR